ncbi:hypothetical protein ACEPAI_8832 [Sanghuangporus weigelae]
MVTSILIGDEEAWISDFSSGGLQHGEAFEDMRADSDGIMRIRLASASKSRVNRLGLPDELGWHAERTPLIWYKLIISSGSKRNRTVKAEPKDRGNWSAEDNS